MRETTLESRIIFQGRMLTLRVDTVRLSDGRTSEREIVERNNGVTLVPVLPDGHVLLIKQYRHAHGDVTITLPGGGIDARDASQHSAAQRELFEETGYRARRLQHLFTTGGSGTIRNTIYIYLARDLYQPHERRRVDDEEFIELYPQPLHRALALVKKGKIPSAQVSLALLLAAERITNEDHYHKK